MTTVILNVWKRDYLAEQLEHLAKQTVLPASVWIVHYENHLSTESIINNYRQHFLIEYFHSSVNLKYYGRFSLANFVETDYIWFLDDDVMPGPGWLETCIRYVADKNAIVTCSGRIIEKGNYAPELNCTPEYFKGDAYGGVTNFLEEDTFVDFGIQSYFIRKEWIKTFWSVYPYTFETAEDIHLCASLKTQLGVSCIVPQQTSDHTTGNLKLRYGRDENSSWRKPGFFPKRKECLEYAIKTLGWRPMLW